MNVIKSKILNCISFIKDRFEAIDIGLSQSNLNKIILVVVIVLGGVSLCTFSKTTTNKAISDIFSITDSIRHHYIGKPNYAGLSTDYVIREKIFDNRFIREGKIYIGKNINILIGKGKDALPLMFFDNSFDIIAKNVSKVDCISLVEANIAEENIVKLQKITIINPNGEHSFQWDDGKYSLPVKRYSAKDICYNTENIVIWSVE